jgi:hypothetical protein
MQQRHDDRDRHGLQRRFETRAERHEKKRVGEREKQCSRDIGAEDGEDAALQYHDEPELARERHGGSVTHQPAETPDRDEREPRPPAGRG